jgi:hypothetical protein
LSFKKRLVSVGLSAALVGSLAATLAAPAVLGVNSSSGGGVVVPGGTSPAGSIRFAETSGNLGQFHDGSFTVSVVDAAGGTTVSWDTSSTPTVTRNAGVGTAVAGFAGGNLVVTVSGTDNTKLDDFTIGNLKVKANLSAPQGPVAFIVSSDSVGLGDALVTITGTLTSGVTGSGSSQSVGVTADNPALPYFQVTGTLCSPSSVGSVGKLHVDAAGASPAEDVTVTAVGAGTVTGVFLQSKPAGTAVSQQICAPVFPSFVTVGDAVKVTTTGGTSTWTAGTTGNDGANIKAQLGFFDGLLLSGDKVTFTIQTAGVTYSPDSCISSCLSGTASFGSPTLSADRKSLTVPLTADTTAGQYITFDPNYDVALGVPAGTEVDVAVTVSRSGVMVIGSPVAVAFVGTVVVGSTAVPTVFINQNDQPTGMITLHETAAGAISGGNIEVCLVSSPTSDEEFSNLRYFWAVVTAGDLKLNVGGLPASQGLMTRSAAGDCLSINVYTASTVASTIEIRDGTSSAPSPSAPTNGPRINVFSDALPGPVAVDVSSGGNDVGLNIVIAMRAYSGTPMVAALSQPTVLRGQLGQAGGDITITEGAPGQFYSGLEFSLCIEPRGTTFNRDVFWSTPVGANAPVVTTNNAQSNLTAHIDLSTSNSSCLTVDVDSNSVNALGVITIRNLKFDVTPDAVLGPVFVRVTDTASLVNQVVSNATVGLPATISADSALGVTQTGPFSTTTKVQALGKYVTFRFQGGSAMAGQTVEVWGAVKNPDGSWGPFTLWTKRVANSSGTVFYYYRSSTAKWISVRVKLPTPATWSPARQARWR